MLSLVKNGGMTDDSPASNIRRIIFGYQGCKIFGLSSPFPKSMDNGFNGFNGFIESKILGILMEIIFCKWFFSKKISIKTHVSRTQKKTWISHRSIATYEYRSLLVRPHPILMDLLGILQCGDISLLFRFSMIFCRFSTTYASRNFQGDFVPFSWTSLSLQCQGPQPLLHEHPLLSGCFHSFWGDGTTMASIFRYKNNKSFVAQFLLKKIANYPPKSPKGLNDYCNFKLPSKTVSYKKTTAIMLTSSFGSFPPPLNRNQPSCWTWTLDVRHWPWQLRSTQEGCGTVLEMKKIWKGNISGEKIFNSQLT